MARFGKGAGHGSADAKSATRARDRTAALDLIELLLTWQHPSEISSTPATPATTTAVMAPMPRVKNCRRGIARGSETLFAGIAVNHGMSEGDRDFVGEQEREELMVYRETIDRQPIYQSKTDSDSRRDSGAENRGQWVCVGGYAAQPLAGIIQAGAGRSSPPEARRAEIWRHCCGVFLVRLAGHGAFQREDS